MRLQGLGSGLRSLDFALREVKATEGVCLAGVTGWDWRF